MIIAIRPDFTVFLARLETGHLAMLRALPDAIQDAGGAWSWCPVSDPADKASQEILQDWENFSVPELRAHCGREIAVFLADVAGARPEDGEEFWPEDPSRDPDDDDHLFHPEGGEAGLVIEIPPDHIEAWYGALNQARLAIEANMQFGAGPDEPGEVENWPLDRQAAFWQFRFYAAIQEALLHCMENRG